MKWLVKKLSNQKGAALVEFAIVLPLLMVLVFGMIEFSILLLRQSRDYQRQPGGSPGGDRLRLP